ncbi:tyrosine-type recombinase/integrase [Andreprevotia sp. IGB-42]|uniref:tyrosine-type recombinase/integrase n=1 Tax=Andreprevotia sp. IGB-42 TaxID=2497473 RepID=UPI00135A500C|nr:tyrosine-type recombinase/integrase [Andreprevotia sp. IGB-42]
MGRKATVNPNLPPGMRARRRADKTWYYYDQGGKPRKEIPLGDNYILAVQKWAELEQASLASHVVVTFKDVAMAYVRDVLPTKSKATRDGNLRELNFLLEFFDDPPAPIDSIEPKHIGQYLKWRVRKAEARSAAAGKPKPGIGSVRANREKALFSHIWNYGRKEGYTTKSNPCTGVAGYKEDGRDVYVRDDAYRAVYEAACAPLRDTLDLALFTGQRPADVLKMAETDIYNGALWIRQNKGGAKVRIIIEGRLAELIERITARKRAHKVRSLKLLIDEAGLPFTYAQFRRRFDIARAAAGENWQLRDLRAKAGTDIDDLHGGNAAQDLLAHTNPKMTEQYLRRRVGKLVKAS